MSIISRNSCNSSFHVLTLHSGVPTSEHRPHPIEKNSAIVGFMPGFSSSTVQNYDEKQNELILNGISVFVFLLQDFNAKTTHQYRLAKKRSSAQ